MFRARQLVQEAGQVPRPVVVLNPTDRPKLLEFCSSTSSPLALS
jgi:hypothetical protein